MNPKRGDEKYWFDNGIMAAGKEAYDADSDAWYWFDADGTMAKDKDIFIPADEADHGEGTAPGKWMRYDGNGGMIKGEDCRYGGWHNDYDELIAQYKTMIENGLKDCYLTEDEEDRYEQSCGRISEKLRILNDTTQLLQFL